MTLKTAATAIAFGTLVAGSVGPTAAAETKAVIELFTSQGCSSCPPADKIIGDYADRDDVLALSFNVDYWDYLGWKDTLASPDNSARQRDYAAARGDGQVYTPQVVVDGRTHAVGSHLSEIEAALAANAGKLSVPITLTSMPDAVSVNIGAAAGMPHATLWLVMYDRSIAVSIERGENSGHTMTYSNVVRKMRPIAMWSGSPMSVNLAKSEMMHAKADRCAVLLQMEQTGGLPGPILGAATIKAAW